MVPQFRRHTGIITSRRETGRSHGCPHFTQAMTSRCSRGCHRAGSRAASCDGRRDHRQFDQAGGRLRPVLSQAPAKAMTATIAATMPCLV